MEHCQFKETSEAAVGQRYDNDAFSFHMSIIYWIIKRLTRSSNQLLQRTNRKTRPQFLSGNQKDYFKINKRNVQQQSLERCVILEGETCFSKQMAFKNK